MVLSGPLLRPGDRAYLAKALPWNRRYAATRPGAIALCQSPQDVQHCVRFAKARQVPFVTRSGGHSYAGYSTTGGLMVDVSAMNTVTYDSQTGLAHVAGGARNANVYAALGALEDSVALTHGRCLAVGVAGLVLGGGVGFNMRRHGITCDRLEATEIVTADGELCRCDGHHYDDLLWACKGGGGGNFGINTSFTFRPFPVSEVTVYLIQWTRSVEEVFAALAALLPNTPDRLGAKLSVNASPDGGLTVALLGQLVGTKGELESLLAPAYRIASPSSRTVRTQPYWEGQAFLSEESCPGYSHESSRYVYQNLSAGAIAMIFRYLRRWPGTSIGADWKAFLTGGVIDNIGREATAYVHRGAKMLSSIEVEWNSEDPPTLVQQNLAWQKEFHHAMAEFTSNEAFQNFIDPTQEDFLRFYYAENLENLVKVKRLYDPTNLFRFPQSIPG